MLDATLQIYQSCYMSYNVQQQQQIEHLKFTIQENQTQQFVILYQLYI